MKRRESVERSSGGARALAFLAVSVVAGAAGVAGLSQLLGSYEQAVAEARRPEETVLVMVASRDLYQGVTITEEDLYAVQIPPRFLPERVFLTPEHVVGRTPRERILANELVRSDRLADPEAGVGMNAVIPRGMRAISVDLSDGRALSGFLRPSDYVDVLVTLSGDEADAETTTRTVLQAVFVLGVNHRMGSESDEEAAGKRGRQPPTVTLLVTPDQAEQVAFASTTGRITLAMRSSVDLDPDSLVGGGVTVGALRRQLQVPEPVRARAPVENPDCGAVRFIGGTRIRDYRVNCDGTLTP